MPDATALMSPSLSRTEDFSLNRRPFYQDKIGTGIGKKEAAFLPIPALTRDTTDGITNNNQFYRSKLWLT